MDSQLTLPGLDHLFTTSPEWKPVPATLARIQDYFRGYAANAREIYARRGHIARRIGITVRTLARYLKWLREVGWIATIRRTSRTAYRQILKGPVPSAVPSQPPVSLLTEVPPEAQSQQHHSESRCTSKPDDVACVLTERRIVQNPDSKPLQEAVWKVGPEVVKRAIWLGCLRKMASVLNHGTTETISSARYFLPVVDEVQRTEVSQGYWDHVRSKLLRLEARWKKTA